MTHPGHPAVLALLLCGGMVLDPATCFGDSLSDSAGTTQSTAVEEDAIQFATPIPEPIPKTTSDDPPYSIVEGRLHVFGYALQPSFEIKLPTSLDDDRPGRVSFSKSDNGRWVIIHHTRDVNSSEFWLYDDETRNKPFHLQIGGRHADIVWHGNRLFEVQFFGMGYTMSIFVRVEDPENPVSIGDLLHFDDAREIYVSLFTDGVEIARLFDPASAKERFAIALEYVSSSMLA